MAFEIRYQANGGKDTFLVKLERSVSNEEALQLAQLARSILRLEKSRDTRPVYSNGQRVQTKLGQKPADHIGLGPFKEATCGVRLKMLEFPNRDNTVAAIRILREKTNMPIYSCRDILYGNHQSPIFGVELGNTLIRSLKEIGVFAMAERSVKATLDRSEGRG